MPFTGKATYSAGSTLPEIAEDVGDIIGIVSPFETPLLDLLGDPQRAATSTVHEWLEDSLLPNTDTVDDATIGDPLNETTFTVANADRFRVGDQIMLEGGSEVMLVTSISLGALTVTRGYGGTTKENLVDGATIRIVGNAALEGADADDARFTNRVRRQNYTQIFAKTVEVSGSQLAAQTIALADEMDFQKQERLRELLRDLENTVINGVAPSTNPEGDASTRRTMRGLRSFITTNAFQPNTGDIPPGDGAGNDVLNENVLNAALREIWEQSSGMVDTIVCGGLQKRRINDFISTTQRFVDHDNRFSSLVDVYESDFGVCRVVMSRWVPADSVLLLDSSRIDVMPLAGRSFHFKPLASTGDRESGQVFGEYTLEVRTILSSAGRRFAPPIGFAHTACVTNRQWHRRPARGITHPSPGARASRPRRNPGTLSCSSTTSTFSASPPRCSPTHRRSPPRSQRHPTRRSPARRSAALRPTSSPPTSAPGAWRWWGARRWRSTRARTARRSRSPARGWTTRPR